MKRTQSGLIVPNDLDTNVVSFKKQDAVAPATAPAPKEQVLEEWTEADILTMVDAQLFFGRHNLITMPVCGTCREVLLLTPRDTGGAAATCSCTVRHWPEITEQKALPASQRQLPAPKGVTPGGTQEPL